MTESQLSMSGMLRHVWWSGMCADVDAQLKQSRAFLQECHHHFRAFHMELKILDGEALSCYPQYICPETLYRRRARAERLG